MNRLKNILKRVNILLDDDLTMKIYVSVLSICIISLIMVMIFN